jgi:hypothetical protein
VLNLCYIDIISDIRMKGIIIDLVLSSFELVDIITMGAYVGFFLLDTLYYYLLVKYFKATDFNDKVVFYHLSYFGCDSYGFSHSR